MTAVVLFTWLGLSFLILLMSLLILLWPKSVVQPIWLVELRAHNLSPSTRQRYLDYYGFCYKDREDQSGYLQWAGYSVFLQTLRPPQPWASVLIIPGYYDHSGSFARLCNFLLDHGLEVSLLDLPGLGLSSGERSSIDSFKTYEQLLVMVTDSCRTRSQLPLFVIAHSLGGGITFNCLSSLTAISQAFLVTPFIRPKFFNLAIRIAALIEPLTRSIGRLHRPTSHDSQFNAFYRRDPLQSPVTCLKWLRACAVWNEDVLSKGTETLAPVVFFAEHDTVIDWQFSLRLLKVRYPKAILRIFAKARHQLLNEADPVRTQIYHDILAIMRDSAIAFRSPAISSDRSSD